MIVIKVDLTDKTKIAHEFDCFLAHVKKDLACQIAKCFYSIQILETKAFSMNKLTDAFFLSIPWKINVPGYDDISYNVIKKFFSSLCEPLK